MVAFGERGAKDRDPRHDRAPSELADGANPTCLAPRSPHAIPADLSIPEFLKRNRKED
jgi:hypothetical protein